jgi:hypothetical protein
VSESVLLHARNGGRQVSAASLEEHTGWVLKPEGLCRDEQCIPVRDRGALLRDDGIHLPALAALLRRPLAVDEDTGIAMLGAAAVDRSAQRAALDVSDLSATTLDGQPFSWSSLGRRKKLLHAWASW